MSNPVEPAAMQNMATSISTPSEAFAKKFFQANAPFHDKLPLEERATMNVYLISPDTVNGKLQATCVCVDVKTMLSEIGMLLQAHSGGNRVVLASVEIKAFSNKKVWYNCFAASSTVNPLNPLCGSHAILTGFVVMESDGADTLARLQLELNKAATERVAPPPSPSSSSLPGADEQEEPGDVIVTVCLPSEDEDEDDEDATQPAKLERQHPAGQPDPEPDEGSPPSRRRKLPSRRCRTK